MIRKDGYLLTCFVGDKIIEYPRDELHAALPYTIHHCFVGNEDGVAYIFESDAGRAICTHEVPQKQFVAEMKELYAKLLLYRKRNCNKPKDLYRYIELPYFGYISDRQLPKVLRTLKQYIRESR